MKLSDFYHAPTRPTWMARLMVYIALVVSLTILIQVLQVLFW